MIDIVPRDWVNGAGDLTDANFNTNIRDAYLLLLNAPTGIVGSSIAQSIPNGAAWTAIIWSNPAIVDTETTHMWAAGTPTRLTCRTPGWYELTASVTQNVLLANYMFTSAFRVNGAAINGESTMVGDGGVMRSVNPATLLSFAAGDYVELVCNHTYSAAIALQLTTYNAPLLTMRRVRGIG